MKFLTTMRAVVSFGGHIIGKQPKIWKLLTFVNLKISGTLGAVVSLGGNIGGKQPLILKTLIVWDRKGQNIPLFRILRSYVLWEP